jgi:small ligand-binding sensory domain FIST
MALQPETTAALAEIVDSLSSRLAEAARPGRADLVLAFVSPHHAPEVEAIGAELRRALEPACLIGCTAEGLIGESREIEGKPALAVFAASLPGATLQSFHVTFETTAEGGTFAGLPLSRLKENGDASAILLADPFAFPLDELLRAVNREAPGVPLLGGVASGAMFAGQNRLLLNDAVHDEGAVGVVLSGNVTVRHVVSQGCRPVGSHFVVTQAEQNVIQKLGGAPAVERLQEVFRQVAPGDRELLQRALHLGRAIDVTKRAFDRGDFLVRSVIGIDPQNGAIAINDHVRKGQTVQFLVRDPASASEDLRELLQGNAEYFRRHPPRGGLLFSCNGRGTRMFGAPDHDATAVRSHVPAQDLPLAGFFAAGEVGPVGGQNFLHGFTASIGLLCEKQEQS